MKRWGKRKSDGQHYPMNRKSKLSKIGSTKAGAGVRITKPTIFTKEEEEHFDELERIELEEMANDND